MDGLLKSFTRRTTKFRITWELTRDHRIPLKRASDVENVSIPWRHHANRNHWPMRVIDWIRKHYIGVNEELLDPLVIYCFSHFKQGEKIIHALIARFMGPTWGPSGADRTQVGSMLAPWILLSGYVTVSSNIYDLTERQMLNGSVSCYFDINKMIMKLIV